MVVAQRRPHLMEHFMTSIRTLIRIGLVVMAVVGLSTLSSSQEFSESQLDAAKRASSSAPLSKDLDTVLPLLVQRVQTRLISLRPDLHAQITETVQAVALKLVARRADLDSAIALVWARMFTEEELNEIAEFYNSPVGKKFVELGPEIGAVTIQTVDNWSSRVGEELLDKSREELKKQGYEL
jgi:uncharacterized protein